MKSLIVLIIFSFSVAGNTANVCAPSSAQFFGQIKEKQILDRGDHKACFVKFQNFRDFRGAGEFGKCILDEMDAVDMWFLTSRCEVQVGDNVSGYLSVNAAGEGTW